MLKYSSLRSGFQRIGSRRANGALNRVVSRARSAASDGAEATPASYTGGPVGLEGAGILSDRDVTFMLEELIDTEGLLKRPYYAEHSMPTIKEYYATLTNVANTHFKPHNVELDKNPPIFVDGRARVSSVIAPAIETLAETGFMAASLPEEHGGLQMPHTAQMIAEMIIGSASMSISSYPSLAMGVANVLSRFGSDEQRERFLPHILSGRFMGTMCLSEPQAGSSLADISTIATEMDSEGGNGKRFSVKGNKMWISGGEQDATDNIIHLVLAKIKSPDGKVAPGVKGISMFIVPKHDFDFDGEPPEVDLKGHSTNGIELLGLNEKLGWKGTTNTALSFGDSSESVGYLVGEPGRGLEYMFLMMNGARIGVGLAATALGGLGYRASLAYALDRRQGRPQVKSKDGPVAQVPIIQHADVRRMLMAQKCYVEGSLSLCMYAAYLLDDSKTAATPEERKTSFEMLDLLTPVVKSYPSEWCLEANKWAIQILGGCGYTKDFPVEEFYRTNRLNMIHEGTNGVQSLDLLGRKIARDNGKQSQLLYKDMRDSCESAKALGNNKMAMHARDLESAINEVDSATKTLLSESKSVDGLLCNSHEYLNMFGTLIMSWMWLKQASIATKQLETNSLISDTDRVFYEGKQLACEYFYRYDTPSITTKARLVSSLDDTLLRVDPVHF
ncbi:hypothetical protein SARC_00310 [Sphaeroforma arctica JP610]|uniref:Acyl-CoA dehydrogenase n=1 Tax=Sphaeroforma arctica JP610 TaxID=667725 RepID=A0A0L0GF07_9EUKA|nr:hypothetical protein SARC_00310 [Sphaeroforma arctica JP610]KNC87610.1 hypothetical protein SARC_00310 [Sphaeroforma arctica JP610]|eukprot:XP_014161512.1 hypothetical protein SARC_00310 [Sphaeroforma arctica JP610]